MKQRTLPGTDLALSVVGMGCWAIGGKYWGDDVRDEVSVEAIHAALDAGINWFDTAPLYGLGHADEVLRKALGTGLRDVIVATKVGPRTGSDGHALSDLTAANIRADVESSLQRLGIERIDLLQIHWPCELGTPLEETMEALAALVRAGKVRYVGVCNYSPEGMGAAARAALQAPSGPLRLVSLQTPYSLLRREFEHGLREAAQTLEMGVLAYEPLCRGLLSGKFTSQPTFPETDLRSRDERFSGPRFQRATSFVKLIREAAARMRMPVSTLAVAWVCAQPGITAAIAGAKTARQIRENASAFAVLDHTRLWEAMQKVAAAWRG